ncbi:MAG: hypothetical protein QM486_05385 [Flavobacteriaceae bacterium]
MKNFYLILASLLLSISCSNNDDISNETFKLDGRFTHRIPDCDNNGSPEINCIEFIEFIDNSKADVLIGAGDIVYRTSYDLNENKIELKKGEGLNFDISFIIQNESTLNRIEDNGIWLKTE